MSQTTTGMHNWKSREVFSPTLFTDLYELTMAQAYDAERMEDMAVFELRFRELPESRNYIVAAGIQSVLEY